MTFEIQFYLFGFLTLLIDALAVGTIGYFIFRTINKQKERFYLELLIVFATLLIYDYFFTAFALKLDISIGNKEFLELIDYDINGLFEFDYVSVIIAGIQAILGYRAGMILYKKLSPRVSQA